MPTEPRPCSLCGVVRRRQPLVNRLRLTLVAILLAWVTPGSLLAQALLPAGARNPPASFSIAAWNPWAVHSLPSLVPEPIRVLAPPLDLPVWGPRSQGPSRLALKDLRGHVVVLDFWTRSCPPCIPLHQALVRLAPAWHAQGVQLVSVLSHENPDGLDRFLAEHGGSPPFPILLDPSGQAMTAFGSTGFPTLLVIDHYGRIAHKRLGGSKGVDELEALFPTLLAARLR